MAASLEARLLARVEPDTAQWGCWLWAGALQSQGYGEVQHEGRTILAHRAAFVTWVGPIPPDRPNVLHRCDTPACIRPDHLFAGTKGENSADMVAKGRQSERPSTLTAADIPVIRARLAAGELQRVIAADYGVRQQAISKVARGQRWRHVAL